MKAYLCFEYGGHLVWDYLIYAAESRELRHGGPQPLATHVYLSFTSDLPGAYIVEAVMPRVRGLHAISSRLGARCYALADGDDAGIVHDDALKYIGRNYDLPGLLVALGYAAAKDQDHWYETHHDWVFCSELAVLAIRTIRPCLPELDADCVTPAHLEAWVTTTAHLARCSPAA